MQKTKLNEERVELFRDVWSRLRVPVRPGQEGLTLYRKTLGNIAEKKVLILGATPELVDMALELQAEKIFSIERNPEIIEAMKRLGKKDWSSVKLIAGDWLEENSDFYSSFNYIACDGGLLFLRYPDQWKLFFKLVHRYLSPGGIFVAKEWAEPPGKRDYDNLIQEMLDNFDVRIKEFSRQDILEAYMYLASELRLATFINATEKDASFNQTLLMQRADALLEALSRKYPDSEMVKIAESALKYLARSQTDTTDVVAGAKFDRAEELLLSQGFTAKHFPLPDRPVPDANYMFVAEKSEKNT